MTATSSLLAAILTPASILFWSNAYAPTATLLRALDVSPLIFLSQTTFLLAVPLVLGMTVAAKAPDVAERIRKRTTIVGVSVLVGVIIDPLRDEGAALADRVSGTVRLSIYELMAQFLTEQMPALRARLPDVEFELSVAHLGANLSKREADLLLRECLPDTPGLIARKLGTFAYAVYGAAAALDDMPAARGEERYTACPWVSYDEEHNYFAGARWLLARRDRRTDPVPRPTTSSSTGGPRPA